MIEVKSKTIESTKGISCPECGNKMIKLKEKYTCFKCGISLENKKWSK